MVYIDINSSNTHADPLLGSRWVHSLVILLVYVTKGNICKGLAPFWPDAEQCKDMLVAHSHSVLL